MPLLYKIKDETGKTYAGISETEDIRVLRRYLHEHGWYILKISPLRQEEKNFYFKKKAGLENLIMFTHQLGSMLEGGIPLVKALEVLWRQSDSPDFQIAISRIRERLDKGSSLAEAFGEFPRIFPQIYCALLHVAEKGGGIVEILRKLGDYLNFQKMLITRIKRAIIYPAIVFVFSIVVVILMFIWVIPTFRVVLTRINVKLPFLTQLMLDISSFMRSGYFWIGLGIILSFLFIYYKKFSRTVTMDNLKLKLPLFGSILYTNLMIKFLYSLHLLIEAGVPLVTALSIAKTVVLNKKILQALDTVEKSVIEGSSFSHSLATTKMFPLLLIQMVTVGEESGTLPEMLRRSYLHFEEELDYRINKFLTAIEPLLIIFLGGVVIIVLLSVYLPIFKLWSGITLMR